MALNKAYNQYKENSIFTSNPEDLTLMLYNGLIKFIMKAQQALDEKALDKTNNCIIRAQDIIIEFQATLDKKYDIAKSLDLIYDYMYRRLVEANISKDRGILEEVLNMAKELRDTWAEAMKIAKKQGRKQQSASGV